jgi:uncharacterized protein YwlG (UPF0340 family)
MNRIVCIEREPLAVRHLAHVNALIAPLAGGEIRIAAAASVLSPVTHKMRK